MNSIFSVNIAYRNKAGDIISTKDFSLEEYTEMLRYDMLRILIDLETMIEKQAGTKNKDEWNPEVLKAFNLMRHEILDSANSVARIPQNLCVNGKHCSAIESSRAIAEIINQI